MITPKILMVSLGVIDSPLMANGLVLVQSAYLVK